MLRGARVSALCGLAIAMLSACDRPASGEAAKTTTAISTTSASDTSGFRLDGERFEPAGIFAIGTEGESSWRITVTRTPSDCASLRSRYPEHPVSAGSLDLWLAQRRGLAEERDAWSVRGGFVNGVAGGRALITRGAMVEGVRANETVVAIKGLELALQEHGQAARLYQFDGDLLATNCGRVSRPEANRPQTKLNLRIDGVPVVIRGASVRPEGNRHYLRLTRAPHRCDSAVTEGYDFYVELALTGDPPRVALVALIGETFPESATGSKGSETFNVQAKNWRAETGNVVLTLNGTLDAGGTAVAFEGELDALRCTPAPR